MKNLLLYMMVLLYVAAGLNHFWHTKTYTRIMPAYIPWHLPLVYISGCCEIVFALLLLPQTTRSTGAWLIIALLIAVFPANIQMSINYYRYHNPDLWLTILRLPLQVLLIWWAWLYTK